MAITCPRCGSEFDATLFQFGHRVPCHCGVEIEYPGTDQRGGHVLAQSKAKAVTIGRHRGVRSCPGVAQGPASDVTTADSCRTTEMAITLETPRLILREMSLADLDFVADMLKPQPRTVQHSRFEHTIFSISRATSQQELARHEGLRR